MDKGNFSLEASLVDLNSMNSGNFNRGTMTHLEREIDGSIQLYPVQAYVPAIDSETSAFLLEPMSSNELTWNLNLANPVWILGSNVRVQSDECKAPDSSYLGDRITWAPGRDATQIIKRTLKLNAGSTYTLSALLRLEGGRFTSADVIRMKSGVVGVPSVSLSSLNRYVKRYRWVEMSFVTAGSRPRLPQNYHQKVKYDVTNIGNNTIEISISVPVNANALVGAQVLFDNVGSQYFQINGNTAMANDRMTLTLGTSGLAGLGINTSSKAILTEAAKQAVDLEIYCENVIALDWGGMQIEEQAFRTSMIYQQEAIAVRSAATLVYRNSPIANLRTCGLFMELKYWRGNGNLFDCSNFKGWIQEGQIYVQAGSTVLTDSVPLPTQSVEFFVQASEETARLSLYVNGILKAQGSLTNFVANPDASLIFTSEGVRSIQRVLTTDRLLLDGQPTVGDIATDEVGNLFSNPTVIDATAISAHAPLINLNPVTVPAKKPPIARNQILVVNTNARTVTLTDASDFQVYTDVTVLREMNGSLNVRILAKNGNDVTLNSVDGINNRDILVYGNLTQPGKASARFPFDPIDQQEIREIAADTVEIRVNQSTTTAVACKRLKVAESVTAFNAGETNRGFIVSSTYEDIAEVLILKVDEGNRYLYVSDHPILVPFVEADRPGWTIAQPRNELIIDPDNYFAGILNPVDGIKVSYRYSNGIVLENENAYPVTVRPYIRVYL
jgi:hypothetical protein